MKTKIALALLALGMSASAVAADNKITASAEHVNFSATAGSRSVGSLEFVSDFGPTTLVVIGSHGQREYDLESFDANRLSLSLSHDWNDRFTTRTYGSVASDSPVFARHEIGTDLIFKNGQMAYTLGAKRASYFGDVDVNSLSAGAAYYFEGGLVSYRYSTYKSDELGRTHGHLASLKLNDAKGDGSTQLWFGQGTSLHEYDYLASPQGGDVSSISLRRVQPLNDKFAVNLGLGYAKYDLPTSDYSGVTAHVGLTYNW